MCGFKDGHLKLTMIHCDKCGLAVHKECYGFTLYTLKQFTCWPCQAVGRSFEVEERDELGNRRRILQQSRPTKCALCSVSDGIHAMHPLYDSSGPSGRQICNDGSLVWAHTLCAFVLNTKSYLFGCSRDGNYDTMEESEESAEIDDRSENSELIDDTKEGAEFGDSAPVHHFVYIGLKNGNKESRRLYRELHKRRKLRCSICGADDKPEGVLRLCAQCNANDECEYHEFRGRHPSLANNESCTNPSHVGCSRWGGSNPLDVQRVYYFPGNEELEPVATIFCSLHAEDVDHKYQKKKKLLEERRQTEQEQENVARRLEQLRKPPPVPRNNRDDSLEKRMSDDLVEKVGKIQDKDRRQEAFTNRKHYWKRTLKGLEKDQFSDAWKTAKDTLLAYINNGNRMPNENKNSREGSIQRTVSQATANRSNVDRVMEAQRQISLAMANQKQGPQTVNGSAKRKRLQNDARSKSAAGKRRGAKQKKTDEHSDSDDGNEFEWEQNEDEADQQTESAEKSEPEDSEPFSFVSALCHPLPKGCTCFKTEMLVERQFRKPKPRMTPLDGFGRLDLG